jgi:methionine synthase II (cobalamin-independent)
VVGCGGWFQTGKRSTRSTATCEFGEIIGAIAALDADVTTVEAARSRMEFIADLTAVGFAHGIGPGIWDFHSPRVPDVAEITEALTVAMGVVGQTRLWVNPDCGLKTRGYAETEAALRNTRSGPLCGPLRLEVRTRTWFRAAGSPGLAPIADDRSCPCST